MTTLAPSMYLNFPTIHTTAKASHSVVLKTAPNAYLLASVRMISGNVSSACLNIGASVNNFFNFPKDSFGHPPMSMRRPFLSIALVVSISAKPGTILRNHEAVCKNVSKCFTFLGDGKCKVAAIFSSFGRIPSGVITCPKNFTCEHAKLHFSRLARNLNSRRRSKTCCRFFIYLFEAIRYYNYIV